MWEDLTAKLSLEFSEEYPDKPPTVKFLTSMFHRTRLAGGRMSAVQQRKGSYAPWIALSSAAANIYADGSICLDILQNAWSPMYDISAILSSLQSLLCDPNPASPANPEAAKLYEKNRPEYERKVRECIEASWMTDLAPLPEGAEEGVPLFAKR